MRLRISATLLGTLVTFAAAVGAEGGGALPDNDILMKAMVEELERSMEKLVLKDLPRPYFMQYNAEDRLTFSLQAAYGGLLNANRDRFRAITSRVRVGSPTLDNTNVGRGFGGRTTLPLDDDLTALRHAIWRMTDVDYKQAVEILTRKEAFLRQKNVQDRPDDFSPATPVVDLEPSPEIALDEAQWRENVQRLSARFQRYPQIQDSGVSFFAGAVNHWIVNSEGTRLRTADTGVYVRIRAETQADDGMRLGDSLNYIALQVDQLTPVDTMAGDVDALCRNLIALTKAPVLEQYSGPVLFDARPAGKVFASLLADGLCARPKPLGSRGGGDESFEKKIGRRILPRSFQVYDDPRAPTFEGTVLAGSFTYDDEAVPARRVDLVDHGILKTLLAGRAPTHKITRTNGHGRSAGFGDARANIGCLYIADEKGLPDEELKQALIEAARDEGLAFGLRVVSMRNGGVASLGDPIRMYKVYVDGSQEELVRGMQFEPVEPRALKRLLAAGKKREVYNTITGLGSSIIAPAILFEELELSKIEREFDLKPILPSPSERSK